MRPIQARLTFLGFAGVVGGIIYNAVYYQDPHFALRLDQQNTKTVEAPKALPKTTGALTDTIGPTDSEMQAQSGGISGVVAAIQRELKALGYYPGPEDGAAGLLTRAAIMAFEHDRGLVLTGEPTDEVLKKIIFGVDKQVQVPAEHTVSATSKKIVAVVQTVLSDLGYAPGTVDGVLKEETKKAIIAFEKDRKLKTSGRISGQLIQELMAVTDISTGGSGTSSNSSQSGQIR